MKVYSFSMNICSLSLCCLNARYFHVTLPASFLSHGVLFFLDLLHPAVITHLT